MDNYLPWANPKIWGKEKEYVLDALNSMWISGGPYIDKFEFFFKNYIKTNFCKCTSNGTSALQGSLLAIGVKPGDEIILPGFGYMAGANVALTMGLKPVFADIDKLTWCLDIKSVENLINKNTKAIIATHTYGNMCEMNELKKISKVKNIYLIEDAAEAFGSKYENNFAGTIGDIGTFSFHATKTITTGEGGMVCTDNDDLFELIKLYINHGVKKTRYLHVVPGLNFRLSNLQAAFGLAQLECIEKIRNYKQKVFKLYQKYFSEIDGIVMQKITPNSDPLIWAVAVKIDDKFFSLNRDDIMKKFDEESIETRPGFYSSNTMQNLYGYSDVPISYKISKSVISFPSGNDLDEKKIKKICSILVSLKR